MTQPVPNTFLIGAPKSGTTAIARYLEAHPDAFLGYPKEPSYWSKDLARSGTVTAMDSLDDYLAIYAQAVGKQVVLDASTRYLFSDVAVGAVLAFNPDARLIIMLRNPVAMAQAYHMEKHFNHFEDVASFPAAWALQDARAQGHEIPPGCHEPKELQYRDVAALGTQLQRAKAVIPDDQLLVLFHDDFVADPRAVWTQVLAFLDLPDDGRAEFPVVGGAHFNRFPRLSRFYQNPPGPLKPLVRWLKRRMRGVGLAKSILVQNKQREDLTPEFTAALHAAFDAEIRLIETLTDRDLSGWRLT